MVAREDSAAALPVRLVTVDNPGADATGPVIPAGTDAGAPAFGNEAEILGGRTMLPLPDAGSGQAVIGVADPGPGPDAFDGTDGD